MSVTHEYTVGSRAVSAVREQSDRRFDHEGPTIREELGPDRRPLNEQSRETERRGVASLTPCRERVRVSVRQLDDYDLHIRLRPIITVFPGPAGVDVTLESGENQLSESSLEFLCTRHFIVGRRISRHIGPLPRHQYETGVVCESSLYEQRTRNHVCRYYLRVPPIS